MPVRPAAFLAEIWILGGEARQGVARGQRDEIPPGAVELLAVGCHEVGRVAVGGRDIHRVRPAQPVRDDCGLPRLVIRSA